jgi:hypothetical protein
MFDDTLIEIVKDIGSNGLIYVKKREVFPKRMLNWFDTSFSACPCKFGWSLTNGVKSLKNLSQFTGWPNTIKIT